MSHPPTPGLPLGCSYYLPHHDPEDWERDFRRMAEAGFNTIRTAELLASWDSIERFPRQPEFSWLDRTFELAERYGLKILLGTGACCPPIWMLDEYPDLPVISRDGVPYPTGGTWSWACIDHPGYLKESDRYLRQLIERYAGHPALLGWQIHNEPGYPFIPRQGQPMEWYCYCAHTEQRFREWLQGRYGTVEALNEAWRWDPTHHQYVDWKQVRAPRVTPIEWGVLTAWLDWRTFCTDDWTAFIQRQAEIIRQHDAHHPITTNLYGEATDFSSRLGIDPWKLSRVVDAIGYDLYPGLRKRGAPERRREAFGPAFVSWFLDFGRSTALHTVKAFWLPEMESGPLDGWVKGPRYTTTALDIKRWYLEALGHGAKMILYQGYREWDCIPIHWGALVDLNGEPTERYHMAATLNKMVREHEDLFVRAQPVRTGVGVLYSHHNVIITAALIADDFTKRALFGLHEALWTAHHSVEFVSPEYLNQNSYRVLFMPFAMAITKETAEALRRFVADGGTLVGFAKCAMLDDRGWYWRTRPGGGLDQVFGVREHRIDYRPEPFTLTLTLAGRTVQVTGFHHQQFLDVAGETEILGTFEDGSPALTRHRYGSGQAFYFATHLDVAAYGSQPHHHVFHLLLQEIGVKPAVRILGDQAEFVDPHLLTTPEGHLLILINENPTPVDIAAIAPEVTAVQIEELLGLPIRVHQREGLAVELRIPAWDAAALRVRSARRSEQ